MAFSISQPLLELMRAASVRPERVDQLMERRIARGDDTILRPGAHYTRLVRQATGVPVVSLARRNRHLLMTIESRQPFWTYIEHSRNACLLSLPAQIPETAKLALIGRASQCLAVIGTPLDDIRIAGFDDDPRWTVARLQPEWWKI